MGTCFNFHSQAAAITNSAEAKLAMGPLSSKLKLSTPIFNAYEARLSLLFLEC